MQPQALVGLFEMQPRNPDDSAWRDSFGDAAGGVAWAIARASDEESFRAAVDAELAELGATIVKVEEIESLASRRQAGPLAETLTELVGRFEVSGEPQLGDFHLYPHPEQEDPADWLDAVAQGEELSDLQQEVVGNVTSMIRTLDLPLLDGVSLERSKEGIRIELLGIDDHDVALSVLVDDVGVEVDYGWSHVHFEVAEQPNELDEALQFVFAALQGGVKVEVWLADGEVERARTLVLYEGDRWEPFSAWATTPAPNFDDPPTDTYMLSFASTDGADE